MTHIQVLVLSCHRHIRKALQGMSVWASGKVRPVYPKAQRGKFWGEVNVTSEPMNRLLSRGGMERRSSRVALRK